MSPPCRYSPVVLLRRLMVFRCTKGATTPTLTPVVFYCGTFIVVGAELGVLDSDPGVNILVRNVSEFHFYNSTLGGPTRRIQDFGYWCQYCLFVSLDLCLSPLDRYTGPSVPSLSVSSLCTLVVVDLRHSLP